MVLISKYLRHKIPLIVAIKRFDSSKMYIRFYIYLFIPFFSFSAQMTVVLVLCSIYFVFFSSIASSSIKWNGSRLLGVSIIYCRFTTKLRNGGSTDEKGWNSNASFWSIWKSFLMIYLHHIYNHIMRKGFKIISSFEFTAIEYNDWMILMKNFDKICPSIHPHPKKSYTNVYIIVRKLFSQQVSIFWSWILEILLLIKRNVGSILQILNVWTLISSIS